MALEGENTPIFDSLELGINPIRVAIEDEYSLYTVRSKALERARSIGMSGNDLHELEIVVRELVTNVVTHGGRNGAVVISHLHEEDGMALVLDVIDHGPGFKDFQDALEDGYSTRGSLGGGLGSVRRFAERVELVRSGPDGSHLKVTKRVSFDGHEQESWTFALFSRPHLDESTCGDQGTLIRNQDGILLVLADGLGHGESAAIASRIVIQTAHLNHRLSLVDLADQMHKKLRKTRGAAVSLARIRPSRQSIRWLGIGNVTGRIFKPFRNGEIQQQVFANHNGTLGVRHGGHSPIEYKYTAGDWLMMASDGLVNSWVSVLESIEIANAHQVGLELIRRATRSSDDASVMIGRSQS